MLALILCIVECLVDCLFECHCIVECRLALRVRQGSRAEHSDLRDPRIVPVSPMHSSPGSVSASTANSEDGDGKISTEQRWLATLIAGKETRGVRSLTEKRCHKRIERIAQIAIRLLDEEYADKIDEVEIAMETSLLKEAGKGNREDENNEPMFRDKVVKFGGGFYCGFVEVEGKVRHIESLLWMAGGWGCSTLNRNLTYLTLASLASPLSTSLTPSSCQ